MASLLRQDMTKARLYYEAHVTVEASPIVAWELFASGARGLGWRASKFDEDEVDDMSGKWFLSMRNDDLDGIKADMSMMISWLKTCGYEVLRYKIEDTVLDSKHGDVL